MIRSFVLFAAFGAGSAGASELEDPYLWLEDVDGEKSLEWVKAKNETSVADVGDDEDFHTLKDRLTTIYTSDSRIPYVGKRGDWYYNFWQDAKHEKGIWRRTSLEEYRKEAPEWDVLLDLDELSDVESESWVWKGSTCLAPEYQRCLLQLSRGAGDAVVVREFDVSSKTFVGNGFHVPEGKSRISWVNQDTLLIGTDFGEGSLTESGYPRMVKRWTRGTTLESAPVIFEGETTDVSIGGYADTTPGFKRQFVYRAVTFYSDKMFQVRGKKLLPIDKPDDAEASIHRENVYFELRSDWTVGDTQYKAGSLLVSNFKNWMKGKREITVLFEPNERNSLARYVPLKDRVVLNILEDVKNKLVAFDVDDWSEVALPEVPQLGSLSVWAVDSDELNSIWFHGDDYITPSQLGLVNLDDGNVESIKQLPALFESDGLAVSQHFTESKDGTRVPYFQVANKELVLDGSNPTLLYGYGGFEVSLTPGYSGGAGAAWLEQGGVYVVANIRGGGEYGPRWHQAALKENRHRAYEDFEAVGEDLVARQVTSTPKLGILGGSNGGLLMGNMLTRRPDLWGAVVCKVPLLDMKRYHTLLAGASWMGEYGDPDIPEEWTFIQTFSPYHQVKENVEYPEIFFMTSTRDDRVHPGHARKMAARMSDWDKKVLYYENIEGGHGGASTPAQRAKMDALGYRFLWSRLNAKKVENSEELIEE